MNHARSHVGTRGGIQMIPLHASPAGSPKSDLRFHNPSVCMYEHVLNNGPHKAVYTRMYVCSDSLEHAERSVPKNEAV